MARVFSTDFLLKTFTKMTQADILSSPDMLQTQLDQSLNASTSQELPSTKITRKVVAIPSQELPSTKITRKIAAISNQKHKRKAVEQEVQQTTQSTLTKSVNQLLTESKNLLKEAYQIGENVQVALLIDLIESIIQ